MYVWHIYYIYSEAELPPGEGDTSHISIKWTPMQRIFISLKIAAFAPVHE